MFPDSSSFREVGDVASVRERNCQKMALLHRNRVDDISTALPIIRNIP